MSATFAPFGFMPVQTFAVGTPGRMRAIVGGIASGYNTSIGRFDPIKVLTDGTIARCAAGDAIDGIFEKVDYTSTAAGAMRTTSQTWPASQAATDIIAWVYPATVDMVLACQANASLAKSAVGDNADLVAGTTNPSTGWSRSYLDALVGAGNSAQFKVLGLFESADNAWGDAKTKVLVRINEAALGFALGNAI